jgi:hypothetical protein
MTPNDSREPDVPEKPAFVPRNCLEDPLSWEEPDAVWALDRTLPGAVLLTRAREQHALATAVKRDLRTHHNSESDLARALHVRRENLWSKLHGVRPAQENDLILWCWITGEERRSYRPEGLLANPTSVWIPVPPIEPARGPRSKPLSSLNLEDILRMRESEEDL